MQERIGAFQLLSIFSFFMLTVVRVARKRRCNHARYKYLGKKVKDVGSCGLDTIGEVYAIARAIMRDYKAGRIRKATARGRLLLLYHLTYAKNNRKLKASRQTREKAREYIRKMMSML